MVIDINDNTLIIKDDEIDVVTVCLELTIKSYEKLISQGVHVDEETKQSVTKAKEIHKRLIEEFY